MARMESPLSPTSPTQGMTTKRFWRAVVALIACGLAALVVVTTWGREGVVWQDLSAESTSPELHRTIRHLRGPLPLVYLEDAVEYARTGHAPPPCPMQAPSPSSITSHPSCRFDPERSAQRHPHYTIRALVPWDGMWLVRLEPRDARMPLDASVLERLDLPNVPLDTVRDDASGVELEWRGAQDDACALQAPGTRGACSPHRITVFGKRENSARYVTTVELGFARSNRIDRNAVPGMALPAHRSELVASNDSPLLHIAASEAGWTDALPRLDGSDLPQKTHPLEALRAEGRASPLARELEQLTQRGKSRATQRGLPWEGIMRVMAMRMTPAGVVVEALELAHPQGYSRFMVITSPQQAPSRPVNRAATVRYVPFAYDASLGAPPSVDATGADSATSRLALRVHLRMDGIDVHTRGARLEPARACPSDGPSLCIQTQDAQAMAADFERVREGDAKGDLAPSAALLEATLRRYPWRDLYNHVVSAAQTDDGAAKSVFVAVSADADVPFAVVVRTTSALYHRVQPNGAAGTTCPTHIAEADWTLTLPPCDGMIPEFPAHLVDGFVLTRAQ